LRKFRRLSGADKYVLEQRARVQTEAWDERWRRRALLDQHSDELLRHLPDFEAKRAHAARLTHEAQRAVDSLRNILLRGLEAAPFRMEMLYDCTMFPERRPVAPVGRQEAPPEPDRNDPSFDVLDEYDVVGEFWSLLLLGVRRKREKAAQLREEAAQLKYDLAHRRWLDAKHEIARLNAKAIALFEIALDEWWARAQAYQKQQRGENTQIDKFRLRYAQGKSDAVIEFLDATLSHSEYPDVFPMQWEMDFGGETGALIVDYELPSAEDFPTLKAVKYDIVRDTFEQSYWGASEIAQFYDSAIYQTCLRTLHDLFTADEAGVLASVTFNGWVNFTDKVHGKLARACIMSIQATKATIQQANLGTVDPKRCFRTLKGVAGAMLAEMTAVVPILPLKRTDDRFIPANDVTERGAVGGQAALQGSQDHIHSTPSPGR
jgi:restriction system protein